MSSLTKRKIVTVISMITAIIAYYVTTDPDTEFMKDLPFGVGFIMMLGVVIKTFIGIVVIEVFPDMFTDEFVQNNENLSEKARVTPEGAGLTLVALSFKTIAYAMIFAAAVFSSSGIL